METIDSKAIDGNSEQQGGLFDDKSEVFSEVAKIRSEGINNLVSNLSELAVIFKELNTLVVVQGTILDRIDYNLLSAKENTEKAVKELRTAEKHQNCTRATSCLLFLIVLVVVLLLLLVLKHF